MSELIEDGIRIEKKFKDSVRDTLKKGISDESKTELISIAGIEYFNDRLKMMVKFYEENKDVQKAIVQEKVDIEIENYTKRKEFENLTKKESDIINSIIKYKTWSTNSLISRDTGHTWLTVDKYVSALIERGFVEIVESELKRKKRYQLTKSYTFMIEGG